MTFALMAMLSTPVWAQSRPDSTVAAAVATYTSNQAQRGQATYQRNCLACHTAAAYTGVAFRRAWAGRSPFEIWELIRTTMPQDNPGRLKPAEYADIVAYMLRLNGYPAGAEELPAEAEQLRSLIIPATPPAGSP
ncbi:MAG TPA: cytochrome c [Gemmatimonadales bacterium]|nr:cytochrome c [Gemmatimonadales bacterium]